MTAAFEMHDVVVEYPTVNGLSRSLDQVSLTVEAGQILGVVGASAAGKSILARAAVNRVPPPGRLVSGSVLLYGEDLTKLDERRLRSLRGGSIGVIVQNARAHLNPLQRIGTQIAAVYRAHTEESADQAKARALEMLEAVGIPAARERLRAYPHELSGGMAQRALIAMALVCSPRVIIADEPTSGLDVTIQDQILRLLRASIRDLGGAGLLVTRDLGIVASFCDRVAVMDRGKIVEQADVKSFVEGGATSAAGRTLVRSASYASQERFEPVEGAGAAA